MVIKGLKIYFMVLAVMVVLSGSVWAANETNYSTSNTSTTTTNSGSSGSGSGVNTGGTDKVSLAYQCLENLVKDNTKLSSQEAVFSALALGNKKNVVDTIEGDKGQNCWPKAGCKLKETSQALLAYDRVGKSTEDIEKWLLTKNTTATDLIWFLEIDVSNHVPSQCTLKYDGRENKISVGEDMKLSGSPGSCLSFSSSGYWLRINDNCINKAFEVTCDQDFVTSLLYQKRNGETIYVTSDTHSASSLGTTKEQVEAYCFKTGSACDYEGSLWATLALSKSGNEIDKFIPYILALSDENKKYFPSAFVNILTGAQDQYSEVVQAQKQGKFWEIIGSPYNRYYDTSLGMLSLQGTNAAEVDNAKNYLLEIQGKDGCWNSDNIRDTAFILYSGWSRSVSGGSGGGSSGGGNGVSCESVSASYGCARASDCIEGGGSILYSYQCSSYSQFCCSVKPSVETCQEKKGSLCASNQQCSGTSISSADGSCCLGTCQVVQVEDVCGAQYNGVCRSECGTDEDTVSASCTESSQLCCTARDVSTSSGGIKWSWIIILVILIAIVAIAIIYRDKLRMWLFRFKGKVQSKPLGRGEGSSAPGYPRAPPRFGPGGFGYRPTTPRPIVRAPPTRPIMPRPAGSTKEKEMDDTFKKLKEMTK